MVTKKIKCLDNEIKKILSNNEKIRLEKMFEYTFNKNYLEKCTKNDYISILEDRSNKCYICEDFIYFGNDSYCLNKNKIESYIEQEK